MQRQQKRASQQQRCSDHIRARPCLPLPAPNSYAEMQANKLAAQMEELFRALRAEGSGSLRCFAVDGSRRHFDTFATMRTGFSLVSCRVSQGGGNGMPRGRDCDQGKCNAGLSQPFSGLGSGPQGPQATTRQGPQLRPATWTTGRGKSGVRLCAGARSIGATSQQAWPLRWRY